MVEGLSILDALANPLYLLIVLAITYIIQQKLYPKSLIGTFMLRGMAIRLAAALTFAAVYVYYYQGRGDTFYYYDGAKAVRDAFWFSPVMGVKVLLAKPGVFTEDTFTYTSQIPTFWRGNDEVVFMCKLLGVIMTIAFKSYWLATILITAITFTGAWKMFRFFQSLYPALEKQAAYSVLFIPSALFWGSGILKDTVCFAALGWMLMASYNILVARKHMLSSVLILLFAGYLILNLKAYILYAFVPALFIWTYMRFRPKSEAIAIRYSLTPLFLAAVLAGMGLVVQSIGSSSEKYAIGELESRAKGFQNYHTQLADQGQSGYSLGEVSFTPAGMVASFPAAVNVTFFRPYLWEIQDPFQALSALESLFFFYFFLATLYRVGILRVLRIIGSNPDVAMCLVFSLIFGYAVGVTAYNFGALVRFKIPGLPFFLMALILIRHVYALQKEKAEKEAAAILHSKLPAKQTSWT
jgi:hypothetical protein